MDDLSNIPLILDFAFELPAGTEIESGCMARDSVTWGVAPSDDD